MENKEQELVIRELVIRPANRAEWETIMEMVWETFLIYEAPEYTEEGVRQFQEFITDQSLYRMFCMGVYQIFVAVRQDTIVGMISLRDVTHISLLFVRESCLRQGIGRELVFYLWNYLNTELGVRRMSVNAAPYGVAFYKKIGFAALMDEQTTDGIRYTPMLYRGEEIT